MNDYEDEGYNLLPVLIAALAGRGIARSVAGGRAGKLSGQDKVLQSSIPKQIATFPIARRGLRKQYKAALMDYTNKGRAKELRQLFENKYQEQAIREKKLNDALGTLGVKREANKAAYTDRAGLAGLLAAGGAASLMDNDTSDLFASGLTGVALGGHLGGAFKRLPKDSAVRNFIPYENPFRGPVSGGITGGALGLGTGYALQPEQRENEYFGY